MFFFTGLLAFSAYGQTSMYVHLNNSTIDNYAIDDVRKITFNNGMNVHQYSSAVNDYVIDDLRKLTFKNACGSFTSTLSTSGTDPTGCGTNDGTATATVTGGTSPYAYSWSNSATTSSIAGLSGGTYTVTVTDANSCTANDSVILTAPNAPSVTSTGTDPTGCATNDGTAAATATGGTSPYAYSWSNSATTSGIAGLSGGTYTVTVTDGFGCIVTGTVTILDLGTGPQTGSITGLTQVNPTDQEQYAVSQTIGSSYNWTVNGGSIMSGQGTNAVQIFWGNAGTGQVAVVETDTAGCVGDTVTLMVQIGTSSGIAAHATSLEMLIYPNPFTSAATVVFDNEEQATYQLVLYDMLGNRVLEIAHITSNEVLIEKGSLTTGVYFLCLHGNKKALRGKLMVE